MTATTDPVALNQWIPCAHETQVRAGSHTDTIVLGQKVRLSREFDGSYHCTTLPLASGRTLPLIERYTLIFTTLGDDPRPIADIPEFDEPDRLIANCGSITIKTCPYRLIENFLDMAHFNFVHTDVLGERDGRAEVLPYKTEHRKDVDEIWATDCLFYQPAASLDAQTQGGEQLSKYTYRVMSPFSALLYKVAFSDASREDAISVFIQPKTETEIIAYMPQALVDETSSEAEAVAFQHAIFMQDRIILENQRPKLVSLDPRADVPSKADVSSIQFRRWLKGMGMRFAILQQTV